MFLCFSNLYVLITISNWILLFNFISYYEKPPAINLKSTLIQELFKNFFQLTSKFFSNNRMIFCLEKNTPILPIAHILVFEKTHVTPKLH